MMERIAELFGLASARIARLSRVMMAIVVFIIIFTIVEPLNILLGGVVLIIWLHARHAAGKADKPFKNTVKPSFAFKGRDGFDVDGWFEQEGFDAIRNLTASCEQQGNKSCTLNQAIELPSRVYWDQIAELLRGYGFICDIADGDFYIAWGLS